MIFQNFSTIVWGRLMSLKMVSKDITVKLRIVFAEHPDEYP
jgi:hypothetical protein